MVIVFYSKLAYMKNIFKINEELQDMKLVTINDYTIEAKIEPEMWHKFRRETNWTVEQDEVLPFEDELGDEIQNQIMKKTGKTEEDVSIADVVFSFNNSTLLQMLEKRAQALKFLDFERSTEIEYEMTEYKDKNFQKLTVPNRAFITFKYHSAFLDAINISEEQRGNKGFTYRG